MTSLTRDDVIAILGQIDDAMVAKIIASEQPRKSWRRRAPGSPMTSR